MATARVSDLEYISAWSLRMVASLLRRWWTMETLRAAWKVDLPTGMDSRITEDLRLTVSLWVDRTDAGLRAWAPHRRWGDEPIVIRWLRAEELADQTIARARDEQIAWLRAGSPSSRVGKVRRLWEEANTTGRDARRLGRSQELNMALGWLGVAFALCAVEDWTFRWLVA